MCVVLVMWQTVLVAVVAVVDRPKNVVSINKKTKNKHTNSPKNVEQHFWALYHSNPSPIVLRSSSIHCSLFVFRRPSSVIRHPSSAVHGTGHDVAAAAMAGGTLRRWWRMTFCR
jgi:hypothetical protein